MSASAIYLNGATLMTTPTDRVLEIARASGYAGIEARSERLLADSGELRATAALRPQGSVFSLNGISLSVRGDGSMDRRQLEEDLPPRLRICEAVEAGYLLAVAPRAPGVATSAAIQGIREGLQLVTEAAHRRGIKVAFEFLGFADCPVNTPSLAGELVAGMPDVDVVLDSCHWHASGGGSLQDFPAERMALVHLNDVPNKPLALLEDADRVLPGEGVVDLQRLIAMLAARGYSRPWSLETFNPAYWSEDPVEVARRGMAAVDRLVA